MRPEVLVLSGSATHFENTMEKKLYSDLGEDFDVKKAEFNDVEDIDVAENLEQIREEIEDSGNVFLVGYCLGGVLALLLRTQGSVYGVVALDPPRGIVDSRGRGFKVDKIGPGECVYLVASEQAHGGLPETRARIDVLKTSHSFRSKAEEVSRLVRSWLEEKTEEISGSEASLDA